MKLVFATNNQNKLSEIRSILLPEIEILSLKEINCNEELPETNPTLQQNAMQKARFVFENYGFDCFADDTGLEIDELGGEPGVYSARYSGEHSNAKKNIDKVLTKLKGNDLRTASFRTVIALIIKGNENVFEGICSGNISKLEHGTNGFGYDPVFIPNGFEKTFAEMTMKEKSCISHRAKAVSKLVAFLNSYKS